MFRSAGNFGGAGARARYRNIENAARVDNASPHQLITILFEEVLRAISATKLAMERGDFARQADRQAHALSILQALDASLDRERGGEIATNLSAIYNQCHRLIATGTREKRPELVARAHDLLAQIAEAWQQITN